jgi:hypothetical protein
MCLLGRGDSVFADVHSDGHPDTQNPHQTHVTHVTPVVDFGSYQPARFESLEFLCIGVIRWMYSHC